MATPQNLQIANLLRSVARYLLLIIASVTFLFALFSGSEQFGGGLAGIVQNAPNALPWLVLFGLVYLAWRWERLGGTIITVFGVAMVYYFNFTSSHFYWIVLLITSIITLLGLCLISSSYLRRRSTRYN